MKPILRWVLATGTAAAFAACSLTSSLDDLKGAADGSAAGSGGMRGRLLLQHVLHWHLPSVQQREDGQLERKLRIDPERQRS